MQPQEQIINQTDKDNFVRACQIKKLSPSQFRVLLAILNGNSYYEVAKQLNLSVMTVRNHIAAIFMRFNLYGSGNRGVLFQWAYENGYHKNVIYDYPKSKFYVGNDKKICLGCGEEFRPKRSERKYCSDECYKKHRYVSQYPLKTCKLCDKSFTPKTKLQIYCSPICANIDSVWRKREYRKQEREKSAVS